MISVSRCPHARDTLSLTAPPPVILLDGFRARKSGGHARTPPQRLGAPARYKVRLYSCAFGLESGHLAAMSRSGSSSGVTLSPQKRSREPMSSGLGVSKEDPEFLAGAARKDGCERTGRRESRHAGRGGTHTARITAFGSAIAGEKTTHQNRACRLRASACGLPGFVIVFAAHLTLPFVVILATSPSR